MAKPLWAKTMVDKPFYNENQINVKNASKQ